MNKIYASLLGISLGFLFLGCQSEQSIETKATPNISVSRNINEIKLNHNQIKTAQIQLGQFSERSLSNLVHANGYFDVPPQNKADVSTLVSGYVKKTYLLEGSRVRKGQVLAILENPEFIQKQQTFLEIQGQLEYMKSEFERQKLLDEERITAKKNRIKAEADYKTTLATFNGLKEQLKMIGFNLEQLQAGKITSTINIVAPISGNITKINAVIGKFIDPAEVMFEIINTDHMHIELNVYEKDVLHIKEGQKILFNIPGQGRKNEYTGEMHLVGKSFTNEDRTVQVHAHFDDRKTSFLPGMYVVAVILTGDERVTALPEEAVVQEAGDAYIFVKTNGNPEETSFKKIEILVGKSSNGWIEVKPMESLNPQDSVVLNGTYYLNAELARTL